MEIKITYPNILSVKIYLLFSTMISSNYDTIRSLFLLSFSKISSFFLSLSFTFSYFYYFLYCFSSSISSSSSLNNSFNIYSISFSSAVSSESESYYPPLSPLEFMNFIIFLKSSRSSVVSISDPDSSIYSSIFLYLSSFLFNFSNSSLDFSTFSLAPSSKILFLIYPSLSKNCSSFSTEIVVLIPFSYCFLINYSLIFYS